MIVRGAFNTLFAPGLRDAFRALYLNASLATFPRTLDNLEGKALADWVEEQEAMSIVNPDTSNAPVWRFPAKRKESPIRAYRAWELGGPTRYGHRLRSLAADFEWDGPFVKSDARPLDPKLWEQARKEGQNEYYKVVGHVVRYAGIWAVKDETILKQVLRTYSAPVWGEVDLWGRVAQFTLGYRAEFCMIKKLWLDASLVHTRNEQVIKRDLEKRYGCDVELV